MISVFDEIKSKLRLHEYIAKFISLKLKHGKYIALCPFHTEKTPSFFVDPQKELFHCFGCGVSGDIFDFYTHFNKSNKKEALTNLAALVGINLETKKQPNKTDIVKLHEFFMKNEQYQTFAKQRGLTENSIKKYGIGWAPDRKLILEFIEKENLRLEDFGFNKFFWHMFENRIVFPIYDKLGKLCSFGGRALDKRAKYINGPSSKFFDKSAILYGANWLKSKQTLYLVEGYFDVILMQQAGFDSVACLGTSFTETHLKNAWNINCNLVAAFDGDFAGKKTSEKIAEFALEFLEAGKKISFIQFLENEDPASFIQSDQKLNDLKEIPLFEYIFQNKNVAMRNPDDARTLLKYLLDLSEKIKDPLLKMQYKRAWNNLWWSFGKKEKKSNIKIPTLKKDNLVILLFKCILAYPYILEEVSEYFMRLSLPEKYERYLMELLETTQFSNELIEEIEKCGLIFEIDSKESALQIWHHTAIRFEAIEAKEKETRAKTFQNNFSDEEWERFKEWKIKEEKEFENG